MLKLQKLDSRFSGYENFQFRVATLGDRVTREREFVVLRKWCWETFGASVERDYMYLYYLDKETTPQWAWYNEHHSTNNYLYFKDDVALTHFQLKWM